MKKLLLLNVLLMVFFSINVIGQNTISGNITDKETNQPVIGASVFIPTTTIGTTSDFDGNFSFETDRAYPFTVEVSSIGYTTQTINITSDAPLNIVLQPGVMLMDEVIITASRKSEKVIDAPASVSVLSEAKIAAVASGGNTANLIKNVVGVSVQEHGIDRSVVELRGSNQVLGGRTQIYKDNRPLNEFATGGFESQLTVISPIDIKRIEIVRGPGGALYGPGVDAGVVHYITKDPWDEAGTTLSLSAGEQSLFKFDARHAGLINDKFGYKILFGGMRADDWQIDESFLPLWNGSTTIEGQSVYTGSSIEHSGNLIKEIGNQYVEAGLFYKPKDNMSFSFIYDWAGFKGNRRTTLGDFYIKDAKHNFQLKAQIADLFIAYNTNFLATGDDLDGYGYTATYATSALQPNGNLRDSKLEVQYPLTFGSLDLVGGFDYIIFNPKDNVAVNGRYANLPFKTIGGYVQGKYEVSEKLLVNAIARLDRFDAFDRTAISPRLGLVYKPTPTSQIRASYNRSYANMVPTRFFLDFPITQLPFGADIIALGGVQGVQFDEPTAFGLPFAPNITGESIQGDQLSLEALLAGGALNGALNGAIGASSLAALQNQAQGQNTDLSYLLFRDNIPGTSISEFGVGPADLITTNTFEIGYKGSINSKLLISVDIYNNTIENFESPAIPITPWIQAPNLSDDLQVLGTAAGLTAAEITAIGAAVDGSPLGNGANIGLAESDQSQSRVGGNPQVNFGFTNFGKASYWGSDASLEYYFTPELSAFANYSWISTNLFTLEDLGEPEDSLFAEQPLNTPKNKYRLGVNYAQPTGVTASLAFSHNDAYDATSGIFAGRVEARDLVDLTLGYAFKNGFKVNLSVSNLFDTKYSYFPRLPVIGRVGILNLQYKFGGNK